MLRTTQRRITLLRSHLYTNHRSYSTTQHSKMTAVTPTATFTLNNGHTIPAVGLGTWQSKPGEVGEAVLAAIDAGYTHIDGAYVYGNEKEIGEALKKAFTSGKIKRENLFYTSKLWNTFHQPSKVSEAITKTLSDLQLDYLDLYLIHWPVSFQPGSDLFPKDKDGKVITDPTDIVDTWKELEKLVDAGKVRSIGVSNADVATLKKVIDNARIKPVINQVELHPYLPQPALLEYAKKENVLLTAYSPLGSGKDHSPLKEQVIVDIAKKHGKDPGQILLSWAVQRGTVVIPKSVKAERIASNRKIEKLSEEEIAQINGIKERVRIVDPKEFWGLDLFKGDTADK
ncbi:NADP-dependent oxidoreductase domain-containing protein [Fimicolochytrium jonesii]|uniref:NADP-dependent oxidoreductase domain-containing protein n=1 Tax=Fimicolochytrium jonesii TaxID=1396493 RepID=UPI0022FDBF11|nr:NADP-dependent oxidoreductase domain-containing protein [Fimicolochytrium jonesii]KAI8821759.1 NADP-dependent oxidoreductase domain-containing protein [Fimicolochytrium jonesii]